MLIGPFFRPSDLFEAECCIGRIVQTANMVASMMRPAHEVKSNDESGAPKYGFGVNTEWMGIFEKGVSGRRGVDLVISPALVQVMHGAEDEGQGGAGVLVPAQVCHG